MYTACFDYSGGFVMRKTKVICTIGPACDNEETLTKMCQKGMYACVCVNAGMGSGRRSHRKVPKEESENFG